MSSEQAQGERGWRAMPADDRRRSQRVQIRVSVTLHASVGGRKGDPIKAYTRDVNAQGAMLISPETFAENARLELEHNGTRERQGCHITRAPRKSPEGFYVPVEFDKPSPGFWQVAFPPVDWKRED
ncbi:MAG TPA: PilZ domain-containing protein [Candidatus Acidoferrales bacterium]|nr:PilZ domain-containing protein [Candidatus Acidoferrales bacterium]